MGRHGRGEAGRGKAFPDGAIAVEVDLPVIVVMAEWPYGQYRANQGELENFDLNLGFRQHVGYCGQFFRQQLHGGNVIRAARQLAFQLDPAVRIGGEVLDGIAKDLAVADHRHDVVRGVDCRDEQPDLLDGSGHSCRRHEIADLERMEHDEKYPGGEV